MTNDNLISSLRNMVDDIENLGAAPLTVDVNVLRQAIVHLQMLEVGLNTIKIQGDLIEAMGNEMRAAGCIYDHDACKVVNTLAPPEGFVLVPVDVQKDAERYRWLRDHAPEEWDVTRWLDNETQEIHVQDYLDEAIDAAMLAARPEVP